MPLIDLLKTMPDNQTIEIESEHYRFLGWVTHLDFTKCESLMVISCYSYVNHDDKEDVILVICNQMEGDKNAEQQTE